MAIQQWFSTPVYYDYASNYDAVQEEISSAYAKMTLEKHPTWGGQNHSITDHMFNTNILDEFDLQNFKEELVRQVKQYTGSFSDTDYEVSVEDCWLTQTAPKEHTVVHNHGNTHISGVYYFQTNGKDGSIYFLNSNTSLASTYFIAPDDYVEYPPTKGLFILFPGWLYHGVRSNDTDENRISISFNVNITKKP